MAHTEQWIWLPQEIYPDNQVTNLSGFEDKSKGNFTVAEFKKELSFTKKIAKAELLTPYGKVTCEMNEGKEPIIKYPDGVDITIK